MYMSTPPHHALSAIWCPRFTPYPSITTCICNTTLRLLFNTSPASLPATTPVEEEEEEEEESVYFLVKRLHFTRGMLARGLCASKLAPSPTHVHDNAQHPYLKNLDIYNLQFLIKIYSYTTSKKKHPPIPHAQPAHCSWVNRLFNKRFC